LKRLHLANTRRVWRDLCQRAETESWTLEQYARARVEDEVAHRVNARVQRVARKAELPFLKALDEFNFQHQATLRLQMMGSFLSPDFITEGRNLVLSGKAGCDKTHLATAIASRAIQNGFTALFTTCAALVDDLSSAAANQRSFREALLRDTSPDVLVVDELSSLTYLTYSHDAANVLCRVVNDRHLKKRSMVFTTNKPLSPWGAVLHDEDLARAILDRVYERGRHITLDGPSIRTLQLDGGLPTEENQQARVSGTPGPEFPEPTRASRKSKPEEQAGRASRKGKPEGQAGSEQPWVRASRSRGPPDQLLPPVKPTGASRAFIDPRASRTRGLTNAHTNERAPCVVADRRSARKPGGKALAYRPRPTHRPTVNRRALSLPALTLAAVVSAVFGVSGCTTFTNARPLSPGQHAVALTGGGPLTNVPGIGQIPLPNVTVEGRSGVADHLDVNYGIHLLPALYGAPGAHVGVTWQLFDQPTPVVPALSVGQRLFGFTNFADGRRADKAFYALSQTDLTLSWEPMAQQLFYAGATGYAPLNAHLDGDDATVGVVHFAPFVGVVLSPGLDWLQLNVEGRWLSPTTDQRFAVVDWIGPDDKGVWAVSAGVSVVFSDVVAALLNGGTTAPDEDGPAPPIEERPAGAADAAPADPAAPQDTPADAAPTEVKP